MRIDKWLWAARFYKTRSLAQQAVEGGKITLNGERVKPSKELKTGDRPLIRIGAFEWAICVKQLSDKRGSATVARTLYEESADSQARREQQSALKKLNLEPAAERHGRPTKRERRQLDNLRNS